LRNRRAARARERVKVKKGVYVPAALPLQAIVDRVPIVLSLLKFDARLLDGRGFVLAYFFSDALAQIIERSIFDLNVVELRRLVFLSHAAPHLRRRNRFRPHLRLPFRGSRDDQQGAHVLGHVASDVKRRASRGAAKSSRYRRGSRVRATGHAWRIVLPMNLPRAPRGSASGPVDRLVM